MELKYNINELPEIISGLEREGFKLIKKENDTFYYKHDRGSCVLTPIIKYRNFDIVKPDYNDCSINIAASFDKYFGYEPKYKTNPEVDKLLETKKPKHVAYLLLDGLGYNLVNDNLKDKSVLKKNMLRSLSSVYPSTTACAIPAFESGLEPVNTLWFGWTGYQQDLDKVIIMFRNMDYYTGEALDVNMKERYPYDKFYDKYGFGFANGPLFYGKENGYKSLKKLFKGYLNKTSEMDKSFAYLYWDYPDHTLHGYGTHSKKAIKACRKVNKACEYLFKKMDEDTLVIVSADHGLCDVFPIVLHNYTDLCDTFLREPSIETRCATFAIKEDRKAEFETLFNKYFDAYFKLYKTEDFIKEGLFGNPKDLNSRSNELLGNYIAVATNQYYFYEDPNFDPKHVCLAHHAGMTKEEIEVPFIVLSKNK